MRPSLPTPSLDRLREAVGERVQASSLRAVARQVGMSPSGLHKFLSGGVPYQKSRRKLFEWLQHEEAGDAGEGDTGGVEGTLAGLVRDLPFERREAALTALVDTLRSLYETHGGEAPAWLGELEEGDGAAAEPGGTDDEDDDAS